jgi:hypothetical protein
MEWSDHPEFISGILCRKLPLYSKKIKVAAFDLDETLIKAGRSQNDWKLMDPNLSQHVGQWVQQGYPLLIN